MKIPAAAISVALVLATLTIAVPSSAAGEGATPPEVRLDSPRVRARSVSGAEEPVRLRVSLTGTAPFTWTGRASIFAGDIGRPVELVPAPGSADLREGDQLVEVSNTTVFGTAGAHPVWFTVTDANGASTTAQTTVRVVGKVHRPRVKGVSGSLAPGRKRLLWGLGDVDMPPEAFYRAYLRPSGASRFNAIGTARVRPNGRWSVRTRRLRPGTVYVKVVSPYVIPTRSAKVRFSRDSFRSTAPSASL